MKKPSKRKGKYEIKEPSKWKGKYEIKVHDKTQNKIVNIILINNIILDEALIEVMKPLYGETTDIEIKYLAVGTGTASITGVETSLGSEVDRYYRVDQTVSGLNLTTDFTIGATESQFVIKELGIFAGSTATNSSETGLLVSRVLYNYDKTGDDIELQITRIDTINRI